MTIKDLKDLINDAGLDDNTEICIVHRSWNLIPVQHYGLNYSKENGKVVKRVHIDT